MAFTKQVFTWDDIVEAVELGILLGSALNSGRTEVIPDAVLPPGQYIPQSRQLNPHMTKAIAAYVATKEGSRT